MTNESAHTALFKPDILIDIEFRISSPEETVIRTNAKEEALEELLTNWIFDQMNSGKNDGVEAAGRDVYRIRIGLRIEDDAFACESDTGNFGLTVGIVSEVLNRLEEIKVTSLS